MKIHIKNLLVIFLILLLAGCGNETVTPTPNQPSSSSSLQTSETETPVTPESSSSTLSTSTQNTQEYLFEAKNMDTIQLTGQEILDGKQTNMNIAISDNVAMDFHISRDNPNGVKLYGIYDSNATNFAYNDISPDVFDNYGEAFPDYTYQIACYDFDDDGIKEIIIACGNRKDTLSLFVFEAYIDSEISFSAPTYILGYTHAYVNDHNEICVPSPVEVKTYRYDIAAYDAEYARLSGPLKISVDYATDKQLIKYEHAHQFSLYEEAPDLLLLPQETLKDFRLTYIEYDGENDKFNELEDLYLLPEITPTEPLILKYIIPTMPSLKVSYITESGMKQSCVIVESGLDGSIFLIEQGIE